MSEGAMLTENALRCVAQDIELFYKKNAQNKGWCISICRNAADQFEKMRDELRNLREANDNECESHACELLDRTEKAEIENSRLRRELKQAYDACAMAAADSLADGI